MIVVHELGHFLVGRKMGIKVESFSVGFGPKLVSITRHEINYAIRLIPFGGSCKFMGEDEDEHKEGSMLSAKPWKRFLTILAGPLANLLLALLCMITYMMINGNNVPVVRQILDTSHAYEKGLRVGDIIRKVNGNDVPGAFEVKDMLDVGGNPTKLTVTRDNQVITLTIPRAESSNLLGIEIGQKPERVSVFRSVYVGTKWLLFMTGEMYQTIGGLITGKTAAGTLMGPVGVVGLLAQETQNGFLNDLLLAAVISLNLCVFNLLPIPALDGARLVFIIYEMIRKKPFPPQKEGLIHLIGLVLLFGLMILLTFKDIRTLFS
jgi:regulator of sigma E protease